jgi:glucan phosphoethanolaminetransferase (alkaline phosphatase superfamily)
LHLIGSHPDACSRTNGKYDARLKSEEISCYVQSIKNTDALLKQVANIAIKHGGPWSLIYFADHGLSHINNRSDLSHSDKYKENYSPPFVMINHDSDSVKKIDEVRSGLDFMKIFSQWIGIKDKRIKYDCEYFENVKCLSKAVVLDGNLRPTDFSNLPSDPAST